MADDDFDKLTPSALAFDIDGVVANTMALFLDIARRTYGINHLGLEDITSYQLDQCLDMAPETIDAIVERIISGCYASRLEPLPGARRVLNRLAGIGPIRLVTARPTLGPVTDWMQKLFDGRRVELDLVATGSFEAKAGVLKQRQVRYFVEDRLDTCFHLHRQGIVPVVFRQPWNRLGHPFVEVSGWDSLERLIDFS